MVTVSGDGRYPAKVSLSRVNVKLEIVSSVSTWNATILCSSWTQIICEVRICISANDDHAARNTPDVHHKFEEGYHVVMHIDRYWGGLFTDLIIEQVLMRSVKTHGGLTRAWLKLIAYCGSCPYRHVSCVMPCRISLVCHMRPVTNTRISQRLDKLEMSMTPWILSATSHRGIHSFRIHHCST